MEKYYELLHALTTIMDVIHGTVDQNQAILKLLIIPIDIRYFRRKMAALELIFLLTECSIVSDIFSLLEDI